MWLWWKLNEHAHPVSWHLAWFTNHSPGELRRYALSDGMSNTHGPKPREVYKMNKMQCVQVRFILFHYNTYLLTLLLSLF